MEKKIKTKTTKVGKEDKGRCNLSSLKFRVYTKWSGIFEDINRACVDLPEEVTKSFQAFYKYFNCRINCSKEYDQAFKKMLWNKYYEDYMVNNALPKDSFAKVSSLIKGNNSKYANYLSQYLVGKINSFKTENEKVIYCTDMVYYHLTNANINQHALNQILNYSVDISFTSFVFSVAGLLLDNAYRAEMDEEMSEGK